MATVYTQAGEEHVVDLIDGTSSVHLDNTNAHVAMGTGVTAAAKGDTALVTESSEARVAATTSQPAADQNRWVATITADGTKTITEAGLFTASTAGILIIRGDFGGIAVDANDSIEFTFELEQT